MRNSRIANTTFDPSLSCVEVDIYKNINDNDNKTAIGIDWTGMEQVMTRAVTLLKPKELRRTLKENQLNSNVLRTLKTQMLTYKSLLLITWGDSLLIDKIFRVETAFIK